MEQRIKTLTDKQLYEKNQNQHNPSGELCHKCLQLYKETTR